MASIPSLSHRLFVGAILFISNFHQASALSAEYCSGLNTAQTPSNSSIYQSNGLCYNFCLDDWAFAILQGHVCWCSNDAPGTTTSTDDCNTECPGYQDDLCGNTASDLFGYLSLTNAPTATVDGAAATSSSSPQVTVTATPPASTIEKTMTVTPSISSSSAQSFSSTSISTSTSSSSSSTPTSSAAASSTTSQDSSSSSSTWIPTPVTSLETITGQVRTVTVTPTVPPNSQSLTGVSRKSGSSGLSTGGAVGLTVGLVALVALVCSIIYFCMRKRRKERARTAAEFETVSRRGSSAGLGGPIPSRTMSENSRYVLGTDGRQVVETWEPENRSVPGSRRSRLMPVDPRLDPFAPVYQRGENKSRESVNTIRDDHDYSRRVHQQGPILRATNPDQ